jgi:hypothetical protein
LQVGAPRNLARGAIRISGEERNSLTRKGLSRLANVSQENKDVNDYCHPSIRTNDHSGRCLNFLPWFYMNQLILKVSQVIVKKKKKKIVNAI